MIYVVTVEGVYRHAILGVYDSLELAEARAKYGAEGEADGYHAFAVGTTALNTPVEDIAPLCYYRRKNRGDPVLRYEDKA